MEVQKDSARTTSESPDPLVCRIPWAAFLRAAQIPNWQLPNRGIFYTLIGRLVELRLCSF